MPEGSEELPRAPVARDVAEPHPRAIFDRAETLTMPPEIARLRESGAPVWIFAYGSLMWNPEIACAEARPALLHGYHRRFCLYSYDYRGTREQPGLVLGLDRGGTCWGMALRLDGGALAASLDTLWSREMSGGGVYQMRRLGVRAVGLQPTDLIRGGSALSAYGFVVRRDHPDYAGRLPLDEAARLIAAAVGERGFCRDYLASTLCHLEALGLRDQGLRRLGARVAGLAGTSL